MSLRLVSQFEFVRDSPPQLRGGRDINKISRSYLYGGDGVVLVNK
jgi:hypothetical protein